jgi:hypothetical protein
VYKPIRDFVLGFQPVKNCSTYVLDDCAQAFEKVEVGSAQFFPVLVREAGAVAESLLENGKGEGLSPMMLFAVVCYTIDLRQFGAQPNQNFFDLVNKALQTRDPLLLEGLVGYLHFLMSALHAKPPLPERTLYRGIPPEHIDVIRECYPSGRTVHWSGLTSVSEVVAVAHQFAPLGGVVFEVWARTGRSIKNTSAFPHEKEVLLFPNFEAMVVGGLKLHDDGRYHLTLCEVEKKANKFVF